MTKAEIFKKLCELNVSEHTESKNGLTYLSWAWAWQKLKEICPDAEYAVIRFGENHLPYVWQAGVGFMCFTRMVVHADDGEIVHEMWLPVMDNRNKAILEPTMFDVNKTIMRCLTKNISMFGLGLYIYAGEDLPTEIDEPATVEQMAEIVNLGANIDNVCRRYRVERLEQLTKKQAQFVIDTKKKAAQG